MAKKAQERKLAFLSPSFRDFLVCRNNGNRPFLETFIAEPENVSMENLGTLFGFFEITDHSEDSSYIVNYLFSVLKKEFFLRPGRGAIESFESALHKVNLALSKLASHENVKWIGHLDAVCGVIEKNNIHVTSAGRSAALLLRDRALTDLTEGGEAQAEPNPIRTFQDVLSGRMEEGDKIIVATPGIFDIFSKDEIKRSGLKFSREDFMRFLHTALVNELESAAVIVIDIDRKEEAPSVEIPSAGKETANVFSQAAFKDSSANGAKPEMLAFSSEEKESIKEKVAEIKKEIADRKSGHIYIKEDVPDEPGEKGLDHSERLLKFRKTSVSAMRSLCASSASFISNLAGSAKATVSGTLERIIRHRKASDPEIGNTDFETDKAGAAERSGSGSMPIGRIASHSAAAARKAVFKETIAGISGKAAAFSESAMASISKTARKAAAETADRSSDAYRSSRKFLRIAGFRSAMVARKAIARIGKEYRRIRSSKPAPKALVSRPESMAAQARSKASIENFSSFAKSRPIPPAGRQESAMPVMRKSRKRLSPDFGKLKRIAGKLSYQQRLYLALAILAFFLIPYWIVKIGNRNAASKSTPVPTDNAPAAETSMLPLKNDKNVIRSSEMTGDYYASGIMAVLSTKNGPFAVSSNEIYDLGRKAGTVLPEGFKAPDLAVQMDDLGLILIIKNGRVSAFSPVSGKFQDNAISLDNPKDIRSVGTYMTYLYLLDAKDSQIYRYPRAEGGFGERTAWLKDDADLKQTKDMAVSDSIFVLNGSDIAKFFRGKKQDFTLESTDTPVAPDKLFADENSNLFVLDRKNSRIVEYASDGRIVSQFYDPAIEKAERFSVDSKNGRIYLASESSVSSFGM